MDVLKKVHILSKFQVFTFYGLGSKAFQRFLWKRRNFIIDDLMNNAVCRTAPATLELSKLDQETWLCRTHLHELKDNILTI